MADIVKGMTLEQALARISELEQTLASRVKVSKSREGNMICINGLRAYPWSFYPSEADAVFVDEVIAEVRRLTKEMLPNEKRTPRETNDTRNNGRIYRR